MYEDKSVLALIPARGGSKGIPGKNIKPLCGHPLIAYTISAARKSKYVDAVVVTTDSKEIAEVSRRYGAETSPAVIQPNLPRKDRRLHFSMWGRV